MRSAKICSRGEDVTVGDSPEEGDNLAPPATLARRQLLENSTTTIARTKTWEGAK
jgi:hypothetical protein